MKKIIFFIICLFMTYKISAACDYQEVIDLNTLASNVEYESTFNEKTSTFNLIIYNVVNEIFVIYKGKEYKASNNQVTIGSLSEGQEIEINIYSSYSTNCYKTYLRKIHINIPYLNPYYNHTLCKNHLEYTVCNSKYLSYKNTYKILTDTLSKIDGQRKKETSIIEKKEESDIPFRETIVFIKNNWIKIVLFVLSLLISYLVWNQIYKRKKYKL